MLPEFGTPTSRPGLCHCPSFYAPGPTTGQRRWLLVQLSLAGHVLPDEHSSVIVLQNRWLAVITAFALA
jgi:hypothetical protein